MTITLHRPALRYHGGKWRIAPWILSHFPAHRIYVEPFCGAASVFFQKPRAHAEVLNDLDGDIVTTFRVLRDPVSAGELRRMLELTPYSRAEYQAAVEYGGTDVVQRAWSIIVRAFMGFGAYSGKPSGFRFAPYRGHHDHGGMDWSRYPASIPAFVCRLRGVILENIPALEVIARQDTAETLFYIDPPYVHGTRNTTNTYAHDCVDADHVALAEVLRGVRGHVVLSGYDCGLYREQFKDWTMRTKDTIVTMNARRTECLWLSPRTAEALERQRAPLLRMARGV